MDTCGKTEERAGSFLAAVGGGRSGGAGGALAGPHPSLRGQRSVAKAGRPTPDPTGLNRAPRSLPGSDGSPDFPEREEGWVSLVHTRLGLTGSQDNTPREGHRLAPGDSLPARQPAPTAVRLTALWANSQVTGVGGEHGHGSVLAKKAQG